MSISPERLWADLGIAEPADERQHVRGGRACSAGTARVMAALRTVGDAADLDAGSEHAESIEHCMSLFARGEWFLALGQPDTAQVHFREGQSALGVLMRTLSANLGERVEPVVISGNWDGINVLTPGQYRRGGAYVGALGGRGRGGSRVVV